MHVTHLDDQSTPLAASLRLARLAADMSNGIIQQTPRAPDRGGGL